MKIKTLLILLFLCIGISFSLPNETKYVIPVNLDTTFIRVSSNNYPFVINLSNVLSSDVTFKSYISDSSNILIYDSVHSVILPKTSKLDLNNNKLLLYFNGIIDSSINSSFYICVGSEINNQDNLQALTLSGQTHSWNFEQDLNDTVIIDKITNQMSSKLDSVGITADGFLNNSMTVLYENTKKTVNTNVKPISSTKTFTLEFLFRPNSTDYTTTRYLFTRKDNYFESVIYNNRFRVNINAISRYYSNANTIIIPNEWHHICIVYNGFDTDSTNYNSRLYTYVNGIRRLWVSTSTIFPDSIPGDSTLIFGKTATSTFPATYDEFVTYNDVKDSNYVKTRSNMFFSSDFYTIENGILIENEPQVCSNPIKKLDSLLVGSTKLILLDSLLCDTGKIYIQQSNDTIGTINIIDSLLGIQSPYYYIDTISNLIPSSDYFFRSIFDSDTGSNLDTTDWLFVTTKDTADTTDPWFIPGDITIDSIFRRYSWIDSTLKFYISNMPDSGTIFMKINSIILNPIVKCSEGIFEAKVPIGTPPGLYTKPVLFSVSGGDTTAIDTLGAVRVLKFQVRSVE